MLITENLLDQWVRENARDAQGVIVELVARLVAASCPNPNERRFPLGDSIEQKGPDGFVNVEIGLEPFVPSGCSYWEMGTGSKASTKATNDYRDLTQIVPKKERLDSAFIFVTPLSGRKDWEFTWKEDAQSSWLQRRRKKKEWKDVRVIDGTKLVEWINHFLPVELWLLERISRNQTWEIDIPSQHWDRVKTVAKPNLTPDLFLSQREEAISKIKEILEGKSNQLKLNTRYPDQVVTFVSAYLASLEDNSRIDAEGRCLIISNVDSWKKTCTNPHWKNFVLVANSKLDLSEDSDINLIQLAHKSGHAVICGGPQGGISDPLSIPLQMPSSYQIQQSLEKAGYGEERARALAQKSGGNLGSLLRCIQNLSIVPAWAQQPNADDLAIAVLLGSWNEKSEVDRLVAENLSGKSYLNWIGELRGIIFQTSTPLVQQNGNWKFIPRYEGWYRLGQYIFDDHLDRLKSQAVSIFRQPDPRFDLPAEQRYAASMYGKTLPYSRNLRSSLAESLALLGSHPKALSSCSQGRAEAITISTVREILEGADWRLWASVNDYLPLLAEAAPLSFLEAVEKALQQYPCPFDALFAEEKKGGILTGGNHMTGLFWALETLAWDPAYLIRVTLCLGELASHDTGGQSGNRPGKSLTTIFLPWLSQTVASVPKKVTAIKALVAEFPDIGWELLLGLLPDYHSATSGTRRPSWRETIPDDWTGSVTYPQYFEQITSYFDLALDEAKKSVSKLTKLVERIEKFPELEVKKLLAYLGSDTVIALSEEDRLSVWSKLQYIITRHRRFSHTNWAMKPNEIEELVTVAAKLSPKSPFYLHQRIFSNSRFDLFEKEMDYESERKELEKRWKKAVGDIFEREGVKSVLAFAKVVEAPRAVGWAFGTIDKADDNTLLPELLESEHKSLLEFIDGYVSGLFSIKGWEWVDSLNISEWSKRPLGKFLSFLPFTKETWDRVSALLTTDQSYYWNITIVSPYQAEDDIDFAIGKLIEHDRANAAIRCLHALIHEKRPINTQLAVKALFGALKSPETPHQMEVYDISEIIKALQSDPTTKIDDLFWIEWSYLPLLNGDHGARPLVLWKRLAEEPAFFCELIQLIFRSKKGGEVAEEATEQRKNLATNAYRLLSEWKRTPGTKDDDSFDGSILDSWVASVRKECSESGHLEVALIHIGHVLKYAPTDPSGLWIHQSAASILNGKDAQDMRDGFRTELFNSRGVHTVDPTGKPERELAAHYREKAEGLENFGYSRLAQTLRELAEGYDRDANRLASSNHFDD